VVAPEGWQAKPNLYLESVRVAWEEKDGGGQRARGAEEELRRAERWAKDLGLKLVPVSDNGDCMLEAIRATALRQGHGDVPNAQGLRLALVERMAQEMDAKQDGGLSLRESLLGTYGVSEGREEQWIRDHIEALGRMGTYLELAHMPTLARVMAAAIVVHNGTSTMLFTGGQRQPRMQLALTWRANARHVDGTEIERRGSRGMFKIGSAAVITPSGGGSPIDVCVTRSMEGEVFISSGSTSLEPEITPLVGFELGLKVPDPPQKCPLWGLRVEAVAVGERRQAQVVDMEGQVWFVSARPGSSEADTLLASLHR
jgi:hypothetical protein